MVEIGLQTSSLYVLLIHGVATEIIWTFLCINGMHAGVVTANIFLRHSVKKAALMEILDMA